MEIGTLLEYLTLIRRRLWLILLMLGLTLTVVAVRAITAKPVYSASVRLYVSAPGRDEMTIYSAYNSTNIRDEITEAKNNFGDMLKSEPVARQTIQGLRLGARPADLIGNLSVDNPAGTDFVIVSLKGGSPEEAQTIVNAHVENTLKYIGALKSKPSATMRELISKRLASTTSEFDSANEALRKFRAQHNVGDLTQEIQSRQTVITSLYLERERANAAGDTKLASSYDAAIKLREEEVRNLSALSAEHDTLVAKVRQLDGTYKFLLEKEAEAKLKEDQASSVGYIQIVELAQRPEQPTSQRIVAYGVMGSAVSILAGLMLVFLWEYVANLTAQVRQPIGRVGERPRGVLRPEER